jgi:hypothetical protein
MYWFARREARLVRIGADASTPSAGSLPRCRRVWVVVLVLCTWSSTPWAQWSPQLQLPSPPLQPTKADCAALERQLRDISRASHEQLSACWRSTYSNSSNDCGCRSRYWGSYRGAWPQCCVQWCEHGQVQDHREDALQLCRNRLSGTDGRSPAEIDRWLDYLDRAERAARQTRTLANPLWWESRIAELRATSRSPWQVGLWTWELDERIAQLTRDAPPGTSTSSRVLSLLFRSAIDGTGRLRSANPVITAIQNEALRHLEQQFGTVLQELERLEASMAAVEPFGPTSRPREPDREFHIMREAAPGNPVRRRD